MTRSRSFELATAIHLALAATVLCAGLAAPGGAAADDVQARPMQQDRLRFIDIDGGHQGALQTEAGLVEIARTLKRERRKGPPWTWIVMGKRKCRRGSTKIAWSATSPR